VDCCPFCATDEPDPQRRVIGECELLEELGRGGMGVVWRARQLGLDREVAVKILPGGDLAGAEARARLSQEARATARLNHPNIVTIHDVGEDDGLPFLVMELVEGVTLGHVLSERPISVRQAAHWVIEVARAVQHAHENGVLHRDLKPSNILIEPWDGGGRPRVTDFGLAKLMDVEGGLTLGGTAAGSPAFMAPEQARGGAHTVAADVYGLGAVLYHALTGRPPFQGETAASVLTQVDRDDPVPPRRLNASVPRDLETICLRALDKSPARRYASAAELADDLARFLDDRPVLARPLGPLPRALRWARRRPWPAAAAGLVATLLAAGMLFLSLRAQTDRRHRDELALEQRATRLALLQSQLGEARSLLRLRLPDSRPRVEAMMDAALRELWPADVTREARSLRVAAQALPSARLVPVAGTGTATDDWTMVVGDLPRDRWAQAAFRGPITLRRLADGSVLSSFLPGDRVVTALIGFSPGGRWLAIRHGEELGVWDTRSGTLAFAAPCWAAGRRFGFMHLAFHPGDEAVVWNDGADSVVFDLSEGRPLARWPGSAGAVAWSTDGSAIALAEAIAPRVELRSWPEGEVSLSFNHRFPHGLCALAFAPDGRSLAGGDVAGRLAVWNRQSARDQDFELPGHSEGVRTLRYSEDGRHLLSTAEDATLRLWNVPLREESLTLPLDVGTASAAGHRLGLGVNEGQLHTIDWSESAVLHRFAPPRPPTVPQQLAFTASNAHLLALSSAGAVEMTVPYGRPVENYHVPQSLSVLGEPSPPYGRLVGGLDGLHRFRAGDQQPLRPAARWGWDSLCASADGRWFAASDNAGAQIAIWPASDRPNLRALPLSAGGGPGALALAPDGRRLAVAHRYDPGLLVLDTQSGHILHRLELPPRHTLAWSRDGRWLAASGTTHALWDTDTWKPLALPPLPPNHPPAAGVAFSPDHQTLALTTGSTSIALISLRDRQHHLTLHPPGTRLLYQLAVSPDAQWLAAAAARGEIHCWHFPSVYETHPRDGSEK
jgi:WD40 repeat protein